MECDFAYASLRGQCTCCPCSGLPPQGLFLSLGCGCHGSTCHCRGGVQLHSLEVSKSPFSGCHPPDIIPLCRIWWAHPTRNFPGYLWDVLITSFLERNPAGLDHLQKRVKHFQVARGTPWRSWEVALLFLLPLILIFWYCHILMCDIYLVVLCHGNDELKEGFWSVRWHRNQLFSKLEVGTFESCILCQETILTFL